MPLIRKAAAGSDSFGHTWPTDGATVQIDDADQVAALLAIDDAGFSEVTPSGEPDPDLEAAQAHSEEPDSAEELSEVDPKAENAEAPKPGRRGGRRPAASQE